jgi:16S rRNA (cytidine1402-2'-O)-methyltransferase
VVATPIGNLEDISLRALRSLAAADLIAAEDTRVTRHLLEHHRVTGRLVSVHAHNEKRISGWIVEQLSQGKTVALVSDAGTPAVSDPGAAVVASVREAGFRIVPIPGANACVTALSASGVEGPFLFFGFLPAKPPLRRKALEDLSVYPHTLVFYEAPHRVVACVEDMAVLLGPARGVVIARELTKVFEQIHRCPLSEAANWLRADPDRQRGEFVLVVEHTANRKEIEGKGWEQTVETLLAELPLAQAVRIACRLTGAKRKVVYARALQLSRSVEPARP